MTRWLTLAMALAIAAMLGFTTAQPPAPLPATAAADAFSAGRAMVDVRAIARAPHVVGSAENTRVRLYLADRLRALGFSVREITTPLPDRARKRLKTWGSADAAVATSLVALRPGRDPAAPAVAMMAHFDSVETSPGAADDAAGVAATLEIARGIPQAGQARDLVILLTDAEEVGLVGANGFFAPGTAGDPLAGRIGALVNMETRGGAGRAFMFETGTGNGAMIDLYRAHVADPSTTSMAVKLYELLPNSTDFTPAKQRGIAGFNFAFTGGAALYHSPLATADALDQGSLQHLGGQGLDVTRALVTASALPVAAPDVVFGDVFGAFTFAYPAGFGWVLIAVTAGLIAFAARARRSDWRWPGVGGGVLDGVVAMIGAGVLLYGGNLLSGADGATNYYDRLAALPRLEAQALLLFGAGLALALALVPKRRSEWDGWVGLALLSLVYAVGAQLALPAAGAIFTLPLLLAALAMAVTARNPRAGVVVSVAAAVLGLAWLGGLAHAILLGIGAPTPSVLAAFAPLAMLLLWPLLPRLSGRKALLAMLVLVLAAGGIALWVRLDPVAASVPPWPPRG